ncbi:MAG: hypothetical protein J7M34_11180 [Anaerolineae bacterium]|nr:hypothetical protein [Anaerolineae bacterium]
MNDSAPVTWASALFSDLVSWPSPPLAQSLLRTAGNRALRRLWNDLKLVQPQPSIVTHDGWLQLDLTPFNRAAVSLLGTDRFLPWVAKDDDPAGLSLRDRWRVFRGKRRFMGYLREIEENGSRTQEALQKWWGNVRAAEWTQAYLLQVMEEVEAKTAQGLAMLWAADWGLSWLAGRAASLAPAPLDLEGGQLMEALHAVANGTWGLDTFLEVHGHRAANEFDLSQPRWREDPTPLQPILQMYRELGNLPSLPGEVSHSGDAARLIISLQRLRLQARATLGRVADAVRTWALAAAQEGVADGRLSSPNDVFLLEVEELKQLLTGEWNTSRRAEIRSLLERRRQAVPFPGGLPNMTPTAGWPASPGQATGPARLLTALEDCIRVRPGDVLVLPSADPVWGLLIPWASGVIVESGMPFSAAAALARAWHIPCVVQVPGIRGTVEDGRPIAVDGSTGAVSYPAR